MPLSLVTKVKTLHKEVFKKRSAFSSCGFFADFDSWMPGQDAMKTHRATSLGRCLKAHAGWQTRNNLLQFPASSRISEKHCNSQMLEIPAANENQQISAKNWIVPLSMC